jgi:uncharacterized protein (DUF1697 family)
MPTYIALLRGINLGPRNKIAMADLRELLQSLGHENVRTLILSGNAIFTSRRRSIPRLERQIERAIKQRFGHEIRVLIRSADEMAAVVDGNPLAGRATDGSRLFALFLERDPDRRRVDAIDADAFAPEEFRLGDRVIYVLVRWGVQGSKLLPALSDKRLGVAMTNRAWDTVTKLVDLSKDATQRTD